MTLDRLADVNWLAVIVAAIAYFVLGAAWYAPPVFGNAWMRATGVRMTEGDRGPGVAVYFAPLLTCLLASIATGLLAVATRTNELKEGIQLGLVVGVGVAAAVAILGGVFESNKPKPMLSAAISAGYHVLGLLIVGALVSIWD
jgi:hypothetical protein